MGTNKKERKRLSQITSLLHGRTVDLLQQERQIKQPAEVVHNLYQILSERIKKLDQDEMRSMADEDLLPYQVLGEWITESCQIFNDNEISQVYNLIDMLDKYHEGFGECRQ